MKRDRSLEPALLLTDVVVLVASLVLARLVRQQLAPMVPGLKGEIPVREYIHLVIIFVPVWALCAERLGLSRIAVLTGPPTDLVRALLITQAWGAIAIAVLLVAAQVPINRSLVALFLVLSTTMLLLAKRGQRAWVRTRRAEAVALVIAEPAASGRRREDVDPARTAEELSRHLGRRVERLASTDAHALRARLAAGGIDEVVLPSEAAREKVKELLAVCADVGVTALVRVDHLDLDMVRPRAEVIGSAAYLSYQRREPHPGALLVKALIDRLGGALLVILFAPVMAVVSLCVRLRDGSPVLFVQSRAGMNGHPFPMLKFRTMRASGEAERDGLIAANEMDGPVFKMAEDPRVTSMGRLLRRTSLDELPQLFNVVAGHMSLVGPRPLPLVEATRMAGSERRRFAMKPGITGLWQVSGRSDVPYEEWMRLDLEYLDRWSLSLDLAIMLRTVPAVLSQRGAR